MAKGKQRLTREAGARLADVVRVAESAGPGGVPGAMYREASAALDAAVAAGASGAEVRRAAGLSAEQAAAAFADQLADLFKR